MVRVARPVGPVLMIPEDVMPRKYRAVAPSQGEGWTPALHQGHNRIAGEPAVGDLPADANALRPRLPGTLAGQAPDNALS